MKEVLQKIVIVISVLILSGCNNGSRFSLSSSSFEENGAIPQKYTCQGENISPALSWSGAPQGTKSYVVIMDDEVAPCGKEDQACIHWNLVNIKAEKKSIPERYDGGVKGETYRGKHGYDGPCPPGGTTHIYHTTVYALDCETVRIGEKLSFTRSGFEKSYKGHILGSATITKV